MRFFFCFFFGGVLFFFRTRCGNFSGAWCDMYASSVTSFLDSDNFILSIMQLVNFVVLKRFICNICHQIMMK